MDWINRVYRVQIDITSHCNARCPGCIRTQRYTDDGIEQGNKRFNDLKLSHFDVALWNDLCVSSDGFRLFPNLNQIVLNGTWGDPCMHPELPSMLKTFTENFPNVTINMHTNGGAQSNEWWYNLGKILSTSPHQVIVALDGLKDTHSIYRRGTDYDKILEHVRALNEAGGSPRWTMTVFDHNKHQVDEARKLAKKYEFRRFVSRKSHTSEMHVDGYTITNKTVGKEYYINEEAYGRNRRVPFINIPSRPDLPVIGSQCEWYSDGSFQIDPWGYVLPCCHMAHLPVVLNSEHTSNEIANANFKKHNPDVLETLNLKHRTLKQILSDDWFTEQLEKQVENASLVICQKECGVKNKYV